MVYEDSTLVIKQLNKDWSYSSERMDAYCAKIKKLEGKFYGIEYHHVVRDQNQLVNHLSKLGSSRVAIPLGVFVQDLMAPSIKEDKEVQEVPTAEELVANRITADEQKGLMAIEEEDDDVDTNDEDEDEDSDTDDE
ncbi:uncharacterized protein [Miscanthus floridulus]|uniref:uncharacterized protein n=1 Tax=Miscanthus floridulus TaxID=154761 RepID=UPI003459ED4D